jgi:PIN domain-containing protein
LKIRADEHVSRKIVRALELLVLRADWQLSTVRDVHEARTLDETWLPRFASEGGRAVLSGDSKMLKRPYELKAIRGSGLIVIVMASPWQNARRHEQAASLIWHWPEVATLLDTASAGDCFRVPFTFGRSRVERLKIDYDKAIKSLDKGKGAS